MLAISVVLILPDHFDGILKTLQHLQAQTIAEQLEIILVTPSAGDAAVDETELACFAAWQLVEQPGLNQSGPARSAGIRRATSPFVVFAEDHSFPEPDWAEMLLEAFHQHPDAGAIAPCISNGNPHTLTSWADVYMNFGPFMALASPTALDRLPWHSGCFRREAFAAYEADLPDLLEVETHWHDRLLEDGYTLWITSKTRIHHWNFSRPGAFLREQFANGRIFGSSRAEPMPAWKRWLHASAAPLVQAARFRGIMNDLRRTGRLDLLPRVLPVLAAGMAVNGFGELLGYTLGTGRARETKFDLESRRGRFMIEADRRDLLDPHRSFARITL